MLDILMVTDYVCPYCLVAKEAMEQALRETGIEARIRTQPFELTEEPKARVDTYHDENRKAHYKILVEPARELGLDMKLPPAVIPRPYTRLAFEGWYFACEKNCGDEYNDLMYRAYFIEESDIGDLEVLVRLAEKIGLDGKEYRAALLEGAYCAKEKEAVAYAKDVLRVKTVPTIYINGNRISVERYTRQEMAEILRQEEKRSGGNAPEGETSEEGKRAGFCCGVDGCG